MKKQTFFGTDGIRGNATTHPYLQAPFLTAFGSALSQWATDQHHEPLTFYIGSDTRDSCTAIRSHITSSLHAHTVINVGLAPTPLIQSLVTQSQTPAYGIMITASHNGPDDNGIKLLTKRGKLSKEEELSFGSMLTQHVAQSDSSAIQAFTPQPYDPRQGCTPQESAAFYSVYIQHLEKFFSKDFLQGHTVVLDCANGAMTEIAPFVFSYFGASVIPIGVSPNGHNSNDTCGSTHPTHIQAHMKSSTSFGFSFDGDGDRVIAVTNKGVVKNGDELLAHLFDSALLANQEGIAGTCMSNYGLERFICSRGKQLVRTPVGDKHIAHALYTHNYSLGGEPSGHLIYLPYLPTSDGLFIALLTAYTCITENRMDMDSVTLFPFATKTVAVTHKPQLTSTLLAPVLARYKQRHTTGRSVVRYSGTEPVLRIMVEDEAQNTAEEIAQAMHNELDRLINTRESL